MSKLIDIQVHLCNFPKYVSYDYYQKLHGYVSSLLDNQTYGIGVNDYIYSNIIGGELTKKGIKFSDGSYFIIRTNNGQVLANFLNNIGNKLTMFDGIQVKGFSKSYTNLCKNKFQTVKQSPILVSTKYNWVDYIPNRLMSEIEGYLIQSILVKAEKRGLIVDKNLSIKVVMQHNHKDINYRGIINKGRVFELVINCNQETKEFIMLNGIGRSCGCGFGFII